MSETGKKKDSIVTKINSFEKRLKACTAGKFSSAKTTEEFEKLITEINEAGKL